MEGAGRAATGPGRIYLVGGSSALLLGIRSQTIDIDLKLDPEPKGIFEAISNLKEQLSVNVELASPDLFIPPIPGWRDRSEFIGTSRSVEFFHYDFYGQALAKILRGHATDLGDATAFVSLGKVLPEQLLVFFELTKQDLIRYPAVNVVAYEEKVRAFVQRFGG